MEWLNIVSVLSLLTAGVSAVIVAVDLSGRRQSMRIMNSVWVLTALWAGVAGLVLYFVIGRAGRRDAKTDITDGKRADDMQGLDMQGLDMGVIHAPYGLGDEMKMTEMSSADRSIDGSNENMHVSETPAPSRASQDASTVKMNVEDRSVPDKTVKDMPMYGQSSLGDKRTSGMSAHGGHMEMPTNKHMPDDGGMAVDTAQRGEGGMMGMGNAAPVPHWRSVVLSTLHCGAGCTLADIIGEWFLLFVPLTIAGSSLAGEWGLVYILALLVGVFFQYSAIRQMSDIPRGEAVKRAFKADFFSLTAWQVGMYGWIAVMTFLLFPGSVPVRTTWVFWFMMQLAMGLGFCCALPVNYFLIKAGIKRAM